MASTLPPSANVAPPAELLQYLSAYRVVVCCSCQYAIQPTAILGHLKDIHGLYRVQRRPYKQYVLKLKLDTPQEVIDSKIIAFPVPFLKVQNGFRCLSENCDHLCVSANRIKSHWIAIHGRPGDSSVDWRSVPLQTFFRGCLLRYFTDASHHLYTRVHEVIADTNPEIYQEKTPQNIVPSPPNIQLPINITDAALLQHYITTTSITLSTPTTATLWQGTVLSLAQSHPFLYHGVLAISALNLAHSSHNPNYTIAATRHQSIAMPLFRTAIATVNHQDCDAVLMFMHLLIFLSFASSTDDSVRTLSSDKERGEGDGGQKDDALPPWLYFLRSGCVHVCDVWDNIVSGPAGELATSWDIPIPFAAYEIPHTISLIAYFISLIPFSDPCSTEPNNNPWSREITTIYEDASRSLATALTIALCPESQEDKESFTTWDALRIWPMEVSDEFLGLLSKRHPAALILVAHYCLILWKLETHWYFEGGAKVLLKTVLMRLKADRTDLGMWKRCIEWPVREILGNEDSHYRVPSYPVGEIVPLM